MSKTFFAFIELCTWVIHVFFFESLGFTFWIVMKPGIFCNCILYTLFMKLINYPHCLIELFFPILSRPMPFIGRYNWNGWPWSWQNRSWCEWFLLALIHYVSSPSNLSFCIISTLSWVVVTPNFLAAVTSVSFDTHFPHMLAKLAWRLPCLVY